MRVALSRCEILNAALWNISSCTRKPSFGLWYIMDNIHPKDKAHTRCLDATSWWAPMPLRNPDLGCTWGRLQRWLHCDLMTGPVKQRSSDKWYDSLIPAWQCTRTPLPLSSSACMNVIDGRKWTKTSSSVLSSSIIWWWTKVFKPHCSTSLTTTVSNLTYFVNGESSSHGWEYTADVICLELVDIEGARKVSYPKSRNDFVHDGIQFSGNVECQSPSVIINTICSVLVGSVFKLQRNGNWMETVRDELRNVG